MGEVMGAESSLKEAGPSSLVQRSGHSGLCDLFPQFLCMFEENYPETLKRLFVVKGKMGTICE